MCLTNLQVEYNKLLETRRHNEAMERQATAELVESKRHAVQTEALTAIELNERIRHQQQQDRETLRHNLVSEAEISLHNRAMEAQARADNALKQSIAEMENATKLYINERTLQNTTALKQAELKFQGVQKDLDRQLTWNVESMKNSVEQVKLDQRRTELAQQQQRITAEISKWEKEIKLKQDEFKMSKWTTNVKLSGVGVVPYAVAETYAKDLKTGSKTATSVVNNLKDKSSGAGALANLAKTTATTDYTKLFTDPIEFFKSESILGKISDFKTVSEAFINVMKTKSDSTKKTSLEQVFDSKADNYLTPEMKRTLRAEEAGFGSTSQK